MSKSATRILHIAEQLFNQSSFTAVGVDLIRDESGCSKTTLYTYFKNKQQLVNEVLSARDARFRSALTEYVAEAQGLAALEKIYHWHMQWFQTDTFKGCLFVRAVGESAQSDQQLIEISRNHKKWIQLLIASHCTCLPNPHMVAELFYTLLEGLISRFMVDGYDQQIAAQHWQMILQWVGPQHNSTDVSSC